MEYVARLRQDGRFTLIDFPDCPGCQTQARRGQDASRVAGDALEGWLEAVLLTGGTPPRPDWRGTGRPHLAVRIDPTLAVRLQLRWARLERGLTQAQLAALVGVSRQQISSLESPDTNLTLSTLVKVASALRMDVEIELHPRAQASGSRAVG